MTRSSWVKMIDSLFWGIYDQTRDAYGSKLIPVPFVITSVSPCFYPLFLRPLNERLASEYNRHNKNAGLDFLKPLDDFRLVKEEE